MSDEEYWAAYYREEGLFGFKGLIRDCHFEQMGWRDWATFIATVAVGTAFLFACGVACGL